MVFNRIDAKLSILYVSTNPGYASEQIQYQFLRMVFFLSRAVFLMETYHLSLVSGVLIFNLHLQLIFFIIWFSPKYQ